MVKKRKEEKRAKLLENMIHYTGDETTSNDERTMKQTTDREPRFAEDSARKNEE